MDEKKIIISGIVAIGTGILAGIGYFLYTKHRNEKLNPDSSAVVNI